MSETPTATPAATAAGHEADAISARGVLSSMLILGLLLAAALIVVAWLFGVLSRQVHPQPAGWDSPATPPAPADQPAQLHALRQQEQTALNTYGWVDEDAGLARIPITRARELLLQQQQSAPAEEGESP